MAHFLIWRARRVSIFVRATTLRFMMVGFDVNLYAESNKAVKLRSESDVPLRLPTAIYQKNRDKRYEVFTGDLQCL